MRLCEGVLGSGENGVKILREQGAWGQKDQGAGSKAKYFREQGAENSGNFIKQFHIIVNLNILFIQGANEWNFREQGDCKNDLGSMQN